MRDIPTCMQILAERSNVCSNQVMDLLFWNVDRLAASNPSTRHRFDRIMTVVGSSSPDVIGLTEVNRSALGRLHQYAQARGFAVLHREEDECRTHSVLLVAPELRVTDHATFASMGRQGDMRSEAVVASIVGSSGRDSTLSVVYNYSRWPQVLSDVQDFSDKYSSGRAVIGGDFNMARSLDADPGLAHLGSAAFDRLNNDFGWVHVSAGDEGEEVPTWPVGPGVKSSPRQLDHLFVRGLAGLDTQCSVVMPPLEDIRLSDHAMLQATLASAAA